MAGNGNHDVTGWAHSGEDVQPSAALEDEEFLVARPERKNPFHYILNMYREGNLTQTYAPNHVFEKMNNTTTWQERLAMFLMQTLRFLSNFMANVGLLVEGTGNTVVANEGVLMTLRKLLCSALFFFKKSTLVIPAQNSANYSTIIALMDPRKDLLVLDTASSSTASNHPAAESTDVQRDTSTRNDIFPGLGTGERSIADVMLMASKFAYENEALVKEVVTNSWQMNFVGFYNCWNESQQRFNKQVFIFTDKEHDANAIVVAWRGTDPFNADDWITDVDFSWYDLQSGTGRVHVGFLESLGLGDRHDMTTFTKLRQNCANFDKRNGREREFQQEKTQISPSAPASGLPQDIIDAPEKFLAYDDITKVLKELVEKHPKAKLFITGHSLGGALAMLYPGMLYYFGETSLADRIASVYTFGQPRVGDQKFCQFMLDNLTVKRYFRVVYSNDLIPRLPFDDSFFGFKHWGLCYYFSSTYRERTLKEVPNPNYFNIRNFFSTRANAVYELTSSLVIGYRHGPMYKESLMSFLYRLLALFVPGIGAHSVVNYCNSVRLGAPMPLVANLD